jgi:hypothetical protein
LAAFSLHSYVLTYLPSVEDPSKIQAAAEVSVDVLFASFEKFLKRAWKEHMGPILPPSAIENMQLGIGSHTQGPASPAPADCLLQILESLASSQISLSYHWMK